MFLKSPRNGEPTPKRALSFRGPHFQTMYKFIKTLFYIFCLALVLLIGGVSYYAYQEFEYQNPKEVVVIVPKGASIKTIARELAAKDVIQDQLVFETYVRLWRRDEILKAGEYIFEPGLNFIAVVQRLIEGRVKLYKFTLPEGYNIYQFCALMVREQIMAQQECGQAVENVSLLNESDSIKNLEGYLFPNTYHYESSDKGQDIVKMMVSEFYKNVTAKHVEEAQKMGLSLHQLVTFASIIEKETGLASERPLISSVFHNRLEKGMLLQTDPTVIYGIANFDGNIRRKDLTEDHPYNTYTRPGLPIGPICNPGLESIEAVLHPAQTKYLYFVAKGGDGSHYFSQTLGQHNRAVQYYQLNRGSEPAVIEP